MIDKLINLDIFTILLLIWASMTVLLLIMRAKGAFDQAKNLEGARLRNEK